ncbi:MAG TPA: hypothetical protein VNJ28_08390 [Candidatus Limnocylindrales bacterium]|nr:hypothetical protein [Candidatus Limnocylindrales bacterium]
MAKAAPTRSAPKTVAPNATPEERRWLEEHRDRLSKTTLRAKWVHGPGDRPDRPGQTLVTRSHEVIRAWAAARDARPAIATRRGDRPGVLRFDFRGDGGRLEPVDWDEWFRTFDERKLVMLFQETTRDGRQSNFFRFDSPEREEG